MADLIAKCEVCGSLLDEEDLFCANCGTEAPKREDERPSPAGPGRVARYNFECSGCGASMSYDAASEALQCPFCGSVEMVEKDDARVLAPNRVVPFQINRQGAENLMRKWLGRGFWRPGDLARQASIVKMMPVYVPYWVFQATTHTYWTADTSQTPMWAKGDWCPLSGEHRGSYSGLLIGASGALAPRETAAICPFDLSEGKPPEEVDLENVTVEQFSLARKYARPLARQGLEASEAQACESSYVPGRARNVHVNVRIGSMSSEPVLLPVWIMAYRYRDRVYRFLVNGQTGRATGKAPTSINKILVAVAIAVVALLFLTLLCSGVLGAALGLGQLSYNGPTMQLAGSTVLCQTEGLVGCLGSSGASPQTAPCGTCLSGAKRVLSGTSRPSLRSGRATRGEGPFIVRARFCYTGAGSQHPFTWPGITVSQA